MVFVAALSLAMALLVAGAATARVGSPRTRPRGGSNRCLSHRDTHWVNDNPADLQALLNAGVSGRAASTITAGTVSYTFVDHVFNAVVATDSTLGRATAHGDEIATATYRLRGHAIVIESISQNDAVITITQNGHSSTIHPGFGLFATGQHVDYTCAGSTLTIFIRAGVHMADTSG